MEFKSVLSQSYGRHGGETSYLAKTTLRYNTVKSHTTLSGDVVISSVFYIGIDIMKKARLILDDYVDVLISDCGRYGLIKRVTFGGRKISKSGNKITSCGKITMKKIDSMPIVKSIKIIDHVVDDDGIMFDWPKSDV
jgi:hypothetical protein